MRLNLGGEVVVKYVDWLTEDRLKLIESWAKEGLIDVQIAKMMGIHEATFYDWKQKFPEFSEAVKKGKAVADQLVESALFKRATGFEYEEQTYETITVTETSVEEEFGEEVIYQKPVQKEIMTKRVVKQAAPETAAAKFWLQNRKPDEWRDRRETELSVTIPVDDKKQAARDYIEELLSDE